MNNAETNEKPMSRKSSSFYESADLIREAEDIRDISAEDELKKNLMFEEKDVSLFTIYTHLSYPLDYFYIALAIIGSMASGVDMPVMAYISTDLFSDVGNTSEFTGDIQDLLDTVKDAFNTQVKRFLVLGAIAFTSNFFAICFWSLNGNRMCHRLKRQYFKAILSQEKGGLMQTILMNLQQKYRHN